MSLDDAFGDGKSEPGALTPCLRGLPESVKDTGQVLWLDAIARIANPEDDLAISRCRAHRDATARLRELDGIADEILEHLEEPVTITPDRGKITAHAHSNLERGRGCEPSLNVHRFDDQIAWR